VILITDGLERDSIDELDAEIDRLHRSCRRLIWLNPLLRFDGFEARARGVRTMLSHVDEFRPVHNIEAMAILGQQAMEAGMASHDTSQTEDPGSGGSANDQLDPLMQAERWTLDGRAVAVATVIETWGSAPRPVGSHLVIDADGNFSGSVSGGCVEGAVIAEAADVIASGEPKMLEFGVADETAWRVGLSCGGRIQVYLERIG